MKTLSRPTLAESDETKLYHGKPAKAWPVVGGFWESVVPGGIEKMRLSTEIGRKNGLTPNWSCVVGPQSEPCLQALKISCPMPLCTPRTVGRKSMISLRSPAARLIGVKPCCAVGVAPSGTKMTVTVTGSVLRFERNTSEMNVPLPPATCPATGT